jgi:hypothetical protein
MKRWYTKKSYELMVKVRLIIVILTSPLWLPFYLIALLGDLIEEVLMWFDEKLDKFLDKVIPQIK